MSIVEAAAIATLAALLTSQPHAAENRPSPGTLAPQRGMPLSPAQAAAWDLTVFPDGAGLPPGRGSALEGRQIFAQRCAACHGEAGRGATAEELAGRSAPLTSGTPDKTVGQYWPHATTLFDFIRRAMPLTAPGSLSNDEVYALTAYLLHINEIIAERDEMNAVTLPRVAMPNRDGFIGIDAVRR